MNSKFSANVTQSITIFQYVSGLIFFIINSLVCFLIVFDNDSKGKSYRKYLLSLQLSSTIADMFCNIYAPILLVNCRLAFSESLLAKYVALDAFGSIELCLVGAVATSYFACVYYRRNAVLPPGSCFCFTGVRRFLLFLSLQMLAIIIAGLYFALAKDAFSKRIPNFLVWVTEKSAYVFVHDSVFLPVFGTAVLTYYVAIFVLIVIMISQMLAELKHGMSNASSATKRYHQRAVDSLIAQGIVPNMVYMIPLIVVCGLYLITVPMELEVAAANHIISIASALVFTVITTHTVAHSIAILACSRVYRNSIKSAIRCSRPSVTPKQSFTVFSLSQFDGK